MPYSDKLLDHFQNPRNVGVLEGATVSAEVTNPICGDVLELFLSIHDGRVEGATFRASGCTAAIAAGSVLTELLIGRTVEEAACLQDADVAEALGGLPRDKIHCSVMAEEAIAACLHKHGL